MDELPPASERDAEPASDGRGTDPTWLARVLLYGQPATRRRAAAHLLLGADADSWQLLAATVRSDEPWLLRARSLEALGLVAGAGSQQTAERVLQLLVERATDDTGERPGEEERGTTHGHDH